MRAYREEDFPVTIVRPSLTYGETQIALAVNSWDKSYTAVDRMRQGKKVIVPGDGSSLWVITHNTDFAKGLVGLLGHPQAIGNAFHITTDEVMTWDQFYGIVGGSGRSGAATGPHPERLHRRLRARNLGGLKGDKAVSVVFDNSKIKRFVPGYCATVPFAEGIRRTLAWFDADPARRQMTMANARWDKLIAAYEDGLTTAVKNVSGGPGNPAAG